MKIELHERLAAIEHERWTDWQKYLHSACVKNDDGSLTIPVHLVEHWEKQINTPYKKLTEAEKNSDREQVDRYWHFIEYHIRRRLPEKKRRRKYIKSKI